MRNKEKIVVGISCGDINGVGLETILKACSDSKVFDVCTPVLYAPQSAVNYYQELYGLNGFKYNVIQKLNRGSLQRLNLIPFYKDSIIITPGLNTDIAGKIASCSLDLAIQDLNKSEIDILLTLPLNKQNVSLYKKDFYGHTEYLAQRFGDVDSLMMLCNNNLKIATVTNHMPISRVSKSITKTVLKKKISILLKTLKMDFLISKPKVAVLGLNPHAGDNGLMGRQEIDIIEPVIQSFFVSNQLVYGPYSADGFFGSGNYKNFDAILAMYHDQALIPFKAMSFGSGVNYTAGLPIIRVSPDHGVGYDIAGKDKADESSLLSAIFLGTKLYANRKLHIGASNKTNQVS